MAEVMKAIPFTQFSMEMRSGKIIDIDDGFTELLGYTEDDFEAGIVFKQFVPSVEYEEVITELREKFIDKENNYGRSNESNSFYTVFYGDEKR